ncbi:MAG: glycosyltransferase family 2 protein [Candidatus Veblenbacteria bacterium]|nr:glycosyltransferase family 2 protein [Candidatus Veblenbacteria bacterium]
MKTWVVIPAYEAAGSVGAVVRGVLSYVSGVVVVDDGSSDATASEAQAQGARVVRHFINRGYGAALVTGNVYALRQGAEVVVHFDADGQFDPVDIPQLVAALTPTRPSVALGSRFLGSAPGIPWLRRFTLKLAIVFTWATSGLKLTDAHNGLRAFTAEALRLMELRQDRMAASSEIIEEIARLKLPYVEVPVTVTYTPYSRGASKQGRLPVLRIVKDLFVGKILR